MVYTKNFKINQKLIYIPSMQWLNFTYYNDIILYLDNPWSCPGLNPDEDTDFNCWVNNITIKSRLLKIMFKE